MFCIYSILVFRKKNETKKSFFEIHFLLNLVCREKKSEKEGRADIFNRGIPAYLIGSIIHKSVAPTQHWLFFITNNQSCLPVNPEIGRKISYIEVVYKSKCEKRQLFSKLR